MFKYWYVCNTSLAAKFSLRKIEICIINKIVNKYVDFTRNSIQIFHCTTNVIISGVKNITSKSRIARRNHADIRGNVGSYHSKGQLKVAKH